MPEHKFEPFDQVLVKDDVRDKWRADIFSHYGAGGDLFFCVGDAWEQCIPYTPETAHLLGTTQPYEPPKPPHEYKWGDRVEVMRSGERVEGFFVFYNKESNPPYAVVPQNCFMCEWYDGDAIRPLEPANE